MSKDQQLILVQWNSPFNNELRQYETTSHEASIWWERASHPVRETARFSDILKGDEK